METRSSLLLSPEKGKAFRRGVRRYHSVGHQTLVTLQYVHHGELGVLLSISLLS